jgi:poly-gamma-glutamate synthesis protein (capsule biosynthesis protein)
MRVFLRLLCVWATACTSALTHEPVHAPVAFAPVAVPPAGPTTFRVLVGGDVIPHRALIPPASIGAALAPLAALFRSADVVIVNYETATGEPIASSPPPFTMAATPDWMRAVVSTHVTSLTLANNHACDLGPTGLALSVTTARDLGAVALGADESDPWKAQTIAARDGKRVCAVAWTTFVNGQTPCAESHRLAVAKPTREGHARVARAIRDAVADGCDVVVAIAHGGEEYAAQTQAMMAFAQTAADAGASAVVFHHPHVVSPLVGVGTPDGRHVPVFASVGNLVSNQGDSWTAATTNQDHRIVHLNGWTRIGMIADIAFRLDAGRSTTFGYHLVFVENDHVLDSSNPHPRIVARLLDPETDREIIATLSRDAAGPRGIFDDACWIRGASSRGPVCH